MKKNTTKPIDNLDTKEYVQVLLDLKSRIRDAQVKAILAANKELIALYWYIGKTLAMQQKEKGWGSKIIGKLIEDLQKEFPELSGVSRSNIFRMQAFFEAYEIVAQAARQLDDLPIFNIPWFHNVIIIQKVKNTEERLWYVKNAIENGWSRNALEDEIKSNLYHRKGKAITNFKHTLPAVESDLAQQSFKDPYIFDFLTLYAGYVERDVEQGLIENVEDLLIEMGKGFSLYGRQYHLEVGGKDYYIDLLFYHTKLKCYVVVELKAREFDPRDAGQINFYLSAVDDLVRDKDDKPTIGLLLCKTKDNFTAEYALRDINKPIGVAEYQAALIKNLPKDLKSSLPTVAELEAELDKTEILTKQIKQKKKAK